ncbi:MULTISPECIES: hypothetical protein [unclassified Carboxylicivirga]|uniref:hypothetical protein n=1 Tax=Carboxylicivirga TaxID=1628153 RepID=UPI003D331782
MDRFRFISTPEVLTKGNIYKQSAEISVKAGMPRPKAVILALQTQKRKKDNANNGL